MVNEHNSTFLSKITNIVSFILKWNIAEHKAPILNVVNLKILFVNASRKFSHLVIPMQRDLIEVLGTQVLDLGSAKGTWSLVSSHKR